MSGRATRSLVMHCSASVVSVSARVNEEGVPDTDCCTNTSSSSNTPSCKKFQLTSWFKNYYTFIVNIMLHKLLDISTTHHGSRGETSRENYKSSFCTVKSIIFYKSSFRYYGNKLWTCNLIETELRFFWRFGRLRELRPHKFRREIENRLLYISNRSQK